MRFFRNNGLTIVLMAIFLVTLAGMAISGLLAFNNEQSEHGAPAAAMLEYLTSGMFLSALFENWESEFLQMAAYVVLTAYLYQRGSAESRDPDKRARAGDPAPNASWIYAHSLGLALGALFLASFLLHWLASAAEASRDAQAHAQPAVRLLGHLTDAQMWFESLQNWQSEFLSTAVLVVLSIFLRYRGSPESKPVLASNQETGA